jgi:hypothetical protein
VEARAIDLTSALLVATAALCCSVVVGCAFLLVAGDADLAPREWAIWWLAAALACATVAALIALTRAAGGLRPSALGVAWALAFAWPLSGVPAPAALIATLGIGLAVLWGAGRAGGHDAAPAAALLAAAALGLLTAAFVVASDESAAFRPPAEARAVAARDGASVAARERSSPAVHASPDATHQPSSPARVSTPFAARGVASPARAVRAYYRALDRRDFTRAWQALSPAVRSDFGGLEQWRAGFAATLESAPSDLRVTASGNEATVVHMLTAHDRAECGVLEQRFSVHWRLRHTLDGWRATALAAQRLDGTAACR